MSKAAKNGLRLARIESPILKSIAIRFDGDDKDYDSEYDLPESFYRHYSNYKQKLKLEYAINNPYELKRNPDVLYPSLLSVFDTLDGNSEEEQGRQDL